MFAVLAVLSVCQAPLSAAASIAPDRESTASGMPAAKRIIALAPNIVELVFAAGAGSRLVGVTRYSDYPPEAAGIPIVGDAARIDPEVMIKLNPDLVIVWKTGNPAGDIERLKGLGFRVLETELSKLSDIPRTLRIIGGYAGTQEAAEEAAIRFEARLADLKKTYSRRPPVRVFYQIWHEPLMTVNRDHIISDIIEACGGVNVFADTPQLTPTVSMESAMAADPDVVIASVSIDPESAGVWQRWRKFPFLKAVRDGRLFHVHPDLIQRQTPRILDGAAQVCNQLDRARRNGTPSSFRAGIRQP